MLSTFLSAKKEASEVIARPPLPSKKLQPAAVNAHAQEYLDEYAELAAELGVQSPDLAIETFKKILFDNDLPIYSLPEVVKYMDEIAAKESKEQAGWHWVPLRRKDEMLNVRFGKQADVTWGQGSSSPRTITPASDYYSGPREQWRDGGGGFTVGAMGVIRDTPATPSGTVIVPGAHPYARTVPLHALRRIALIEKATDKVKFLVSDYALAPQIAYPDPFLMAVIPNINLEAGIGRFVIDFWDEPGFGFNKMLVK